MCCKALTSLIKSIVGELYNSWTHPISFKSANGNISQRDINGNPFYYSNVLIFITELIKNKRRKLCIALIYIIKDYI